MYAHGSPADQAFRAVLGLPAPELSGWGRAADELSRTGALPLDSIVPTFPVSFVQGWFERCDVAVDAADSLEAGAQLHQAFSALKVEYSFPQQILKLSFSDRQRKGPTAATRSHLKEIAKLASRLGLLMSELRGEILYQRATGARSARAERLHAVLHSSFAYGQRRRQLIDGNDAVTDASDFDAAKEVGARVTLAPTWLEDGLACLADGASGEWTDFSARGQRTKGAAKPQRETFIRSIATIWTEATGLAPTVTGRDDQLAEGKLTAFQTFHHLVCGHTCGLLMRANDWDWEESDSATRQSLQQLAKHLGLAPVPTATSLRRALDQSPR